MVPATQISVTSPDLPKVYFLELNQRRLVSQGHKLKCTRTKKLWYISDIKGTLWRLTDGKFHKVAQYLLNMPDASYPMRKIAHFDLRLLHYDNKNPTRLSLLALLARNKDNLEDLTNYRTEGKGDIISGIGKFLGTTISALAKGGSLIIRSLGQGIHDTLDGVGDLDKAVVGSIGNATTNVIRSTSSGIAKIISSIGGLSTVILWALVILLYIYIFMMRLPGPPLPFLFPPRPETPPPPLPPYPTNRPSSPNTHA